MQTYQGIKNMRNEITIFHMESMAERDINLFHPGAILRHKVVKFYSYIAKTRPFFMSFISPRLCLSTINVGILVAVIMEVAVLDHGNNECVAMYVTKPACLRIGLVFSVVFVRIAILHQYLKHCIKHALNRIVSIRVLHFAEAARRESEISQSHMPYVSQLSREEHGVASCPAHKGVGGNKRADRLARALIF